MSLCKVFLLCFGMMHASSLATFALPVGLPVELGDLLHNRMVHLELPLCDLRRAENIYVNLMFHGHPPKNCSWTEPLRGITDPEGNTSEKIQASVCAIDEYLNHLPNITRNLTMGHRKVRDVSEVLRGVKVFHDQFKAAAVDHTSSCQNKGRVLTSHHYEMKVFGLRIFCFARRWVEDFLKIHPPCV